MNKTFSGDYAATIINYDGDSRTAHISIPGVTDGLDEGIEATFAYPVGDDDKDTEREILPGAECYIFFLQGDPASPVIWAYRSHGTGAVTDHRRIRQKNIELLAKANISLKAEDEIALNAKTVRIGADTLIIDAKTEILHALDVMGPSNLQGETEIEGRKFLEHDHDKVQSGNSRTGKVV